MDIDKIIINEAETFIGFPLPTRADLPDIDLYVEQMTGYLEDRYGEVFRTGEEKVFTKSMVNNYTKAGLLPRPEKKRYGRDHLIALLYVCLLKQALPFTDIERAFALTPEVERTGKIYELFKELVDTRKTTFVSAQRERLSRVREALGDDATDGEAALLYVTLLSVESAANRLICTRILDAVDRDNEPKAERKKQRKKQDEKDTSNSVKNAEGSEQ